MTALGRIQAIIILMACTQEITKYILRVQCRTQSTSSIRGVAFLPYRPLGHCHNVQNSSSNFVVSSKISHMPNKKGPFKGLLYIGAPGEITKYFPIFCPSGHRLRRCSKLFPTILSTSIIYVSGVRD